jgi:hypothetical protein
MRVQKYYAMYKIQRSRKFLNGNDNYNDNELNNVYLGEKN